MDPSVGLRVCEPCGLCYADGARAPRLCPSCDQPLTIPLLAAHMAALVRWLCAVASVTSDGGREIDTPS